MDTRLAAPAEHPAAVVWLDRMHALIARAHEGRATVTEVERDYRHPETEYLWRIAREAGDCDRVVIMGPDASRIAFEREFVALYRRPDRLIDVGLVVTPAPGELEAHLRLVEPSAAVH